MLKRNAQKKEKEKKGSLLMPKKKHRKHTPIVSRKQQKKFGAELRRREAGQRPTMPGITMKQLRDHLNESEGKKLPYRSRKKK